MVKPPEVPPPVDLVSMREVERRLDRARPTAIAIVESGLAGPLYRERNNRFVELAHLDRLAYRPDADISVPALNVKVGPLQQDSSGRWIGFHQSLSSDLRQMEALIGGWWAVRDAEQVVGAALVATVGGFVIAVAKIAAVQATERGQRQFSLTDPDPQQYSAYNGTKLDAQQGALTQRFNV